MNEPMMFEADRETVLKIEQPLPQPPSHMMDLGAALLAATDFAPEVDSQEGQPQLRVPSQLGAADLTDTPDRFGRSFERFAAFQTSRAVALMGYGFLLGDGSLKLLGFLLILGSLLQFGFLLYDGSLIGIWVTPRPWLALIERVSPSSWLARDRWVSPRPWLALAHWVSPLRWLAQVVWVALKIWRGSLLLFGFLRASGSLY